MRLLIASLADPPRLERLLAAVEESGCQVLEMRQSRIGRHLPLYLLVEGGWGAIVRLEHQLASLGQKGDPVPLFWERLEERDEGEGLLYYADIVARQPAAPIRPVLLFFQSRGALVLELRASSYPLPYLDRSALLLHLLLQLPPALSPVALRDEFLDLCDRLRVDGLFEPVKPAL